MVKISESFRGIQFQESDVDLSGVEIANAFSALRCRDSDVRIDGFSTRDTVTGANFFRTRLKLSSAAVSRPGLYGIRFRESSVELYDGTVRDGLVGISIQQGNMRAERVRVESAGLAGIALQDGDVKMTNCRVSDSMIDAVSATKGNADFTGGTMDGYGRHAVKIAGPANVSMKGVEVTGGKGAATPFHDGKMAPGLGVVRIE
jgi:hypothetical protein